MRAGDREGAPAKIRAVDEGVPADLWRRVHPLSPVISAWKALLALLAFITYQNLDQVRGLLDTDLAHSFGLRAILLGAFGGVIVFVLIAGLYSWLAWQRTSYAVTATAVWFRSGILARSQRHARLDRIQTLDIHHPLLGRIFGLGRLTIEVAGGSDSNFAIGFLKTAELEELRAEVLARAAGLDPDAPREDASAVASERAPIPVAPERVVYTVPVGRLLASLVMSMGILASVLLALGVVIGAIALTAIFGPGVLSSLFSLVFIIGGVASYLWGRFAGEFNFTAAVSPDGIRIRSGLTSTRAQTIPPGRVHAVTVIQPLLWRIKGWYRVTITQAGVGSPIGREEGAHPQSLSVLLPVGGRADAEYALWLVVRDLGVDDPQAFIEALLDGTGEGQGFVPVPESAGILDPLARARRAHALSRTCLAVRDGWMTRTSLLVPVERAQSLSVSQGPLERRRGLADVEVEIVPGEHRPIARHVDAVIARRLLADLRVASRVRRSAEPPEKWMLRVSRALPDEPESPQPPATDDPGADAPDGGALIGGALPPGAGTAQAGGIAGQDSAR
ncbi:PH domain-containing protein [Actinomyces sp. B33]|uniref:PH domain-containing protein n=1 Tax=Actinomyces sp. B33 TaxID=2942131 RepID=UPI0023408618|nr:PH domain-containing protein [Actinomyces sp. B33]MDC4232218.1 PH domain-containing protein [Actinomyces sp. B33]